MFGKSYCSLALVSSSLILLMTVSFYGEIRIFRLFQSVLFDARAKNNFHWFSGDDVIGLSVSIRKNDDLVQLWNINSAKAEDCKIMDKIRKLLPNVNFETSFYKGTVFPS